MYYFCQQVVLHWLKPCPLQVQPFVILWIWKHVFLSLLDISIPNLRRCSLQEKWTMPQSTVCDTQTGSLPHLLWFSSLWCLFPTIIPNTHLFMQEHIWQRFYSILECYIADIWEIPKPSQRIQDVPLDLSSLPSSSPSSIFNLWKEALILLIFYYLASILSYGASMVLSIY